MSHPEKLLPLTVLFGLLLVGTSCREEGHPWEGSVVEENGVMRVENPRASLADSGTISAELLWSAQGPPEGDIWEVPRKIHMRDSVLYLVDRQASKVHRVSLSGSILPSLGTPGEGPGEYQRIVDAIPLDPGLFVVDGGNGRVEVLADDGEILTSVPLGQVAFTAIPLGSNGVGVHGVLGRDEVWQRIDARGNRELFEFPEAGLDESNRPLPGLETSWGGRLVRLEGTLPRIWLYSPDGRLERVIHIPIPAEEATEAELEKMVQDAVAVLVEDGLPSEIIQNQAQRLRERLRVKARFRDVVFDGGSGVAAILEQNPEDFGAGPATLHLLSLSGVYLGVLPFDRAWRDFDLVDGILSVLSRDPVTDLVSLQLYRLNVPREVLDRAQALVRGWPTPASSSEGRPASPGDP